MTERYAAITGWGTALPSTVVGNAAISSRIGVAAGWIEARTGILERRVAGLGDTTSSLAALAGRRALQRAGIAPEDLDLVVVATTTPDRLCPGSAPAVQAQLGASNAGAFDLNAACAGSLTALWSVSALISAGAIRRALIAGAEVLSRFLDHDDRDTAAIFGDGAGALVLEASDAPAGVLAASMRADGADPTLVTIPAGGSLMPATRATVENRAHTVRMRGREVYRAAVRTMVERSQAALHDARLSVEDVDLFITHQANQRIIDESADRLGIDPARVFSNVSRYGNTSAASIPIAIAEAADEGRLQPGDTLLLAAIGAGLCFGAAVVRWTGTTQRLTGSAPTDIEVYT